MNHLYWIAAAAPEGNENMLDAMWKSVTNHIQDVHEGHSDLYPACAYGPLDKEERDKEWLQPCKKHVISPTTTVAQIILIPITRHISSMSNRQVTKFSVIYYLSIALISH